MKLTLQLRLQPSREQATALRATMVAFNAAATDAGAIGFATKTFGPAGLSRRCYRDLRERHGLRAQSVVRAIGKAVASFRRNKTRAPVYRPNGAIPYDGKCLTLKRAEAASILTLNGRTLIPMVYGDYQRELLPFIKGETLLAVRGDRFYLLATIDVPESAPIPVQDFLGVDLGVVNVATTSDGETFSGAKTEAVRLSRATRRKRLQREATRQHRKGKRPRGVRRAQARLGQREQRFRAHENHCIAKHLCTLAQDTKRGIAVEDLTHIRSRIRFAKAHRARMGGWSFAQLQGFLAYKARLRGVPYVVVNAAYTSQTCHACGHCDKANRPDQATFVCTACGHSANADVNAAQNIAARALAMAPQVSDPSQSIAA